MQTGRRVLLATRVWQKGPVGNFKRDHRPWKGASTRLQYQNKIGTIVKANGSVRPLSSPAQSSRSIEPLAHEPVQCPTEQSAK